MPVVVGRYTMSTQAHDQASNAYSLPAEVLRHCLRTDLIRLVVLLFVLVEQTQRALFVHVGRSDGQRDGVYRDVLHGVSQYALQRMQKRLCSPS